SGESHEFKANAKLKVTIGNLPAVQTLINGQPAVLPNNGLIVNTVISKDNYREFIAAANISAKPDKSDTKNKRSALVAADTRKPESDVKRVTNNSSATTKPASAPSNSSGAANNAK